MTEDITVKVIRNNTKEPSMYITDDMEEAQRVFDERIAAHSQSGRLVSTRVELWIGNRLVKCADKDGTFDVKYTKKGE